MICSTVLVVSWQKLVSSAPALLDGGSCPGALGAALPLEEAAYSPLRAGGYHSKLSAIQTMFSFIRVKSQLHTYLGQET